MPAKTRLAEKIAALAADFARSVVASLKDTSLSDIYAVGAGTAPQTTRKGKRVRQPHPGWPKCPVCGKNAWPRGKGYCYEHCTTGKAKAAGKAKPARKSPARKKTAKKPQA